MTETCGLSGRSALTAKFREDPYRSFLTFDTGDGVLDRIIEQLETWLKKKGWYRDLSGVGFHRRKNSELVIVRHEGSDANNFRARLTETRDYGGTWRTELTVHVPDRGEGWLLLDAANDHGRYVDAPGLVKYLLQAIDARDGGSLACTDRPTVITGARVEELAATVTDFRRNGLVLVAGTGHELPFDPFVAQVARWTGQTLGLAAVAVLDPVATQQFAEVLGPEHAVAPWTLRTYRPEVDPASEGDGLRHRFLTTERLARAPDEEIARLLGRISRMHSGSRSLPRVVRTVTHALNRVENAYVIDAIRPTTVVAADLAPEHRTAPHDADLGREADSYLAQVSLVKEVFGLDVLDEATLRDLAQRAARPLDADAFDRVTRQLHEQQTRIERLEQGRQDLLGALEDAQLEHAIVDDERSGLVDEVHWLRGRLREQKDYEGAYGQVPDAERINHPESYRELLERLPGLEEDGVSFTGDRKLCLELDAVDTLGRTVRTAWEALLAIAGYLRARRDGLCDQGIHGYLTNTPNGLPTMSPGKHAAKESAVTMRQFGHERVFRVPDSVTAGGMATMEAHFKLGRVGMVSPRLYYLDDFSGTGRVYVGYIGEHLTNTQTN